MQCLNCGAINSEESIFCDTCGQRLRPAPVSPQPVVPAPAVRPSVPRPVSVQPAAPKRRKIPWYVFALAAGVLVICLVVVGVAAYLIFRDTTSSIAYAVNYSDEVDPGLYIMDDDGQNVRLLVPIDEEEETLEYLAWSPNGKYIAYSLRNNDYQYSIWVASVKTAATTQIVEDIDAEGYRFFEWSPDSRQIVYFSSDDEFEIRIVNADGSEDTSLANGAYPSWSPDGDLIAFTTGENWDFENAAVIRPDGSEETIIREDPDSMSVPWSWSPDSKWIAIIFEGEEGDTDLALLSRDGSEEVVIAGNPDVEEIFPVFSPNGRWIAYINCDYDEDYCEIYIVRKDGTESQSVVRDVMDETLLSWSPDSKSLIYTSEDDELVKVNIENGQKTTLADEEIYAEWPAYEP